MNKELEKLLKINSEIDIKIQRIENAIASKNINFLTGSERFLMTENKLDVGLAQLELELLYSTKKIYVDKIKELRCK